MPAGLISHYAVVRRLGAGGMGEVYLAQDTQLERPVALKIMSEELAKDLNQRKRFRTEAKAASGLTHPNICVIHEVGETADGRPFLAMEYVEGQTLDAVLAQRRLKIREVINVGIEVAEALEAAHARGLVHRDIKPANLMLDSRGHVKVMDFGLAKWFAPDELSAATTTVAHTRTGMLIGTPQYMSPEQALGRTLDPRTDIFSLGVVLYELAAGQRPFLGRTVGETINQVVNQPAAPLGLDNPVFSPALDGIILKCLEKEPEKRYASAEALAVELRKLKDDSERAVGATTRDGTSAASGSTSGETKNGRSRHAALGWVTGLVVVALLASGGWMLLRRGGWRPLAPSGQLAAPSLAKSVAVLPFVSMSADRTDDYLSDGLSDDIITALSKVKGLRVPARTSCFVFKGKAEDIRKIGQQLYVATVLEGSVTKVKNRLRITARLIDVANGYQLWATNYDREIADILEIRSEIAQQVVAALKVQLGVEQTEALARKPTENLEAYKLYLQGRYLWNRRTGKDLMQAVQYFNQAIAKDPGYALAHAGLADCYVLLDRLTELPTRETFPKARAAALKALELDGSLAEPRAALAHIKAYWDWDWAGAEADLHQVIALNPNYATAHHWLSILLRIQGRNPEALAEITQAQQLDPLSPVINSTLGIYLSDNGKAELAIELLQRQIAFDPSFVGTHNALGGVYFEQGNWSEAISEFETAHRLEGSGADGLSGFGALYARAGRTNEAQKILTQTLELQRKGKADYRLPIAAAQHALGNDEAALDWLEKALTEHSPHLEELNSSSFWKDLRSHPRVQAILRKMNLAPAAAINESPAGAQKTLAVLPFVNLSADKADEYLSDGISEELIHTLQKLPGLRVQGRGSSFYFKGRNENPRRIGEQLQVTYLLEGSVGKAGNKLRVAADLVRAADGFQVWSTNYDREMADILEIRSDIARQVVTALKFQLGVEETRALAKKPTDNPEAYALCLQGRFWSDQFTSEGFTNGVRLFQRAIELDPGYGLAYAGVAQAYANVADWLLPPGTAMRTARANAEKAVTLDESLAQPHIILGNTKDTFEWDHDGARQEFERALALGPNLAEAHAAYATYLIRAKRFEEARRVAKRAWQLDPLSPARNDELAIVEFCLRNYPEALELSRANARRFPGSILVHLRLAWVCEQVGKYEEALAEMAKARTLDDGPDLVSRHAHIYAAAGQPGKALELQRQLEDWQKRAYVSPTYFAWVHLGLGRTNEAISRLQEAVDVRDGVFVNLNYDPYYDHIRADPRFMALLRKASLPEWSQRSESN